MARLVGAMDEKFEEALMENIARNEWNKRQSEWNEIYYEQSKWFKFKREVEYNIRIKLVNIIGWIMRVM